MSDTPVNEDALLELVDQDPEFLATLVQTFLDDCPEYMDSIRRAVAEGDAEALVEEAHGLKGAVANLKAQPARQAAKRMEELGRDGNLDDAPEALEKLEQRIGRLRSALKDLIRKLT